MPRRLDASEAVTLMREAGVEPLEDYPGSGLPWRCRCRHCNREVTPRLDNVRAGHAACRYCTRRSIDPHEAAARMRLAGLEPLEPYPGADQPWRCRCADCANEITPRYASVAKGSGCRICALSRTGELHRIPGDEAAARMRLAGLEPLEPYPGANRPWRCRCADCESEVAPRYCDVRNGHGCRQCGWRTSGDKQRMDHEIATRVMIGRGLEPIEPYPGSRQTWRCRCMSCGAEVTPRYDNIKNGWGGCRICAGRAASERQRGDAAEAVAVMRAAGLEPLEPYLNVMTPWRSQCRRCGHEVAPRLNNIMKGSGCAWCAGNRVDPNAAVAAMRTAGLEPLVGYPGRHRPWLCRCLRCDLTVTPRYGAVRRGTGCRYCNDTAIDPGIAAALMRGADLEPMEPYPGSQRKWKCQCLKCRRVIYPYYSSIQQGGGGCRWCRNSGFNAGEGALVYFIGHEALQAAKIGITGATGVRLKRHRTRGWHVLTSVSVPGHAALGIEAEVLDWWRADLRLPPFLSPAQVPQGGWSETVDLRAIDLAATIQRIHDLATTDPAI